MVRRRNVSSLEVANAGANGEDERPKKKNWRQPTGTSSRVTRSAAAAASSPTPALAWVPARAPASARAPAPLAVSSSSNGESSEQQREASRERRGGEEEERSARRRRKKLRGTQAKPPAAGGALIVSADAKELVRLKRQVKYFFNNMSMEQSMIDAYSNEGWKGNNREKVKPVKELANAEARIIKFKRKIREAMQELDKMCLEGSILDSAFDDDGQLDYQEIFCARCHSHDVEIDNDIILCDGFCNRGFHQECLNPPLATEDIPPGEDGWLCPICDCKSECVLFLNDRLGTEFEVETKGEDFFPESVDTNGVLIPAADLPSDESDDDDYDPESKETGGEDEQNPGDENENEEDEEDDDDENENGNGNENQNDGNSGADSDDSATDLSGEEPLSGAEDDDDIEEVSGGKPQADDALSDANGDGVGATATGKRRRREVDYKKLHHEMFGYGFEWEIQSEDEDYEEFGGVNKRRLRKSSGEGRAERFTNASRASTDASRAPRRFPSSRKTLSHERFKRIPSESVKRLRQVFEEDQLPPRALKEQLSVELGLSFQKIDIWFKNVRKQASKVVKLKEAENRVLLTQLGEAELKLRDLKNAVNEHRVLKLSPHLRGFENNSVIDVSRGKRLVYVPVASQVVEKAR